MKKDIYKKKISELMSRADIRINGDRTWDISIHNEDFYKRVMAEGSLGFGESYMDEWWDCTDLTKMLTKVMTANLDEHIKTPGMAFALLKARLTNSQRKSKAFEIGEKHYDIGNKLYTAMLDKQMVYTCAYWDNATNLDDAQQAKLDLVCKKIGLKKGMKVLDIGCGWGSFAQYAARHYGVSVVGITVSKEQVKLGTELCKGLSVEIRLQDYRDVQEKFDRIVSLGMFEHVGVKNYHTYMNVVRRCLHDDGLFLLHTIGGNHSVENTDPWIEKYIFPNSMLPSAKQIDTAAEGLFVMEDWHNFGADYEKTLLAWYQNVENNWGELKSIYDKRFQRMWTYYLLSCAASFRSRKNQLWQIVYSPHGVPGGYKSIR